MEEELRFLRESIVEVDAAVVGISSTRWTAIPVSEATPEKAVPIMKANRFDVLPIVASATIKEYFCADEWNTYTSISVSTLTGAMRSGNMRLPRRRPWKRWKGLSRFASSMRVS